MTGAASEASQPLAKGGIEPLNVSGVDDTAKALSKQAQAFNLSRTALDNPPLNLQPRGHPVQVVRVTDVAAEMEPIIGQNILNELNLILNEPAAVVELPV